MAKARKKKREGDPVYVEKTCRVFLVSNDGLRVDIGEFTIKEEEPGPTIDQFADAAFKAGRASLSKLMVPQYRLVVMHEGREHGYGLEHWVKLVDGQKEMERQLQGKGPKQTIRSKVSA